MSRSPQASSPAAPKKRRLASAHTVEGVISQYKASLSADWTAETREIKVWWQSGPVQLACKRLPVGVTPPGFACTGKDDKFQYSFTFDGKRERPVAYRTPFFGHAKYGDPAWTVSHLCHENWCLNWDHHVLEPLAWNKARNGCPGGPACRHRVKCVIPGPFSGPEPSE